MAALGNYSAKEVIVVWRGREISQGLVEGASAVVVARTNPMFTLTVSGDGQVAQRVRNANKSGTVTLNILAAGAINDYLSESLRGEEADPPVPAVGALSVEDLQGNTLHSSPEAFLQGFPQDDMGTEAPTREYVLLCPELLMNPGSSDQL